MGNNQIAMGNNQIANGISPSPSGEVRWGLDVDMLSNNNFYIKTKTNIRSNLFLPFGKVRMGLRLGGGLDGSMRSNNYFSPTSQYYE